MTLLLALYTAAGGILVRGGVTGSPAGNTGMLALGTVLAGLMGTTGAAMVLIHPLLSANAHRSRKVHIVVFFTALVANAGGATTPLGDPPLFIGFLQGVPFLWPLRHLTLPLLVLALPMLAAFYLFDRREAASDRPAPAPERLHIRGWINVALVGVVVATVLLTGVWRPGNAVLLGQPVGWERLVADGVFVAVALVSSAVTPRAVRQGNMFSWHPMQEVAHAVRGDLHHDRAGARHAAGRVRGAAGAGAAADARPPRCAVPARLFLADRLALGVPRQRAHLSRLFRTGGRRSGALTGPLNHILTAISAGAVFFGALTYIGNAPNLMLRAIASHRGVRMPGFFAYMALAGALLLPGMLLLSAVFFL